MLSLIGLGLHSEKDLTLRGIEEAKKADEVYIELYTGKWFGSIKNLEKIIGKKILQLQRKDLEDNSQRILQEAKEKNVVIFVQGDPLVFTTHTSLIIEAKKQNTVVNIVHNSSIVSAVAETGLHIYKFGACVTIPYQEKTKGKLSESVYKTIKENKERGLHTLCLLDVVAEENKYMTINEALKILIDLEKNFKENVVGIADNMVVFCNAGGNMKIFYDNIDSLIKKNITDTPAVVIVPGKLHFTEKEFLLLKRSIY